MIELPPGWIHEFKAAPNKARFLRDWADELYKRARWSRDPERMAELLDAAGGALGSALEREGKNGPYEGDRVRAFSGRLWPHPEHGPWLIVLHWQIQTGKPVCVGLELTSAPEDSTAHGAVAQPLNPMGRALTGTVLRGIRLAEIQREDRTELTEAVEAARAQALGL